MVDASYGHHLWGSSPYKHYANLLEVLGDDEMVQRHFHLYPAAIMFVCGLVEPIVRRHYAYGLPVSIQVCTTLKYLGYGSFLINVSSNMTLDISTTSAWCSVHAVTTALMAQLGRFVKFPHGRRANVVKDGVVRRTECSPESVALQMPGSIARECAGASVATAGVSTWELLSLCVWRRWVRTSWEAECRRPWVALSGLRAWPWVGPESGLREAFVKHGVQRLWSATRGVVCDLSTVSCDRVSRCHDGVVYVWLWA